jgi:hypothetical protein
MTISPGWYRAFFPAWVVKRKLFANSDSCFGFSNAGDASQKSNNIVALQIAGIKLQFRNAFDFLLRATSPPLRYRLNESEPEAATRV